MSDLEPITRAENFWVNEGDLEPITRKEQYIKHLYDETQVVPEYPKTREEYFINKAGEELHDVTVEQLTVTENGTYSEAGKAYSPVIVEVPEPTLISKSITQNGTYQASSDNADGYSSVTVNVEGYKISEVSGLPAPIATFTDGSALPMPKLKVAVEPQQEGSGDPSPENIRPISGWSAVDVTKTGKNIATTEIYKNNYVIASDGSENYASGFIITKKIKIDSSKSCYLSMIGEQSSSSDAIRVGFYDKFLNFISRIERSTPTLLTIPNNAEYIRLSYRNINPYFKDIQIEIGDEATSYEPYNGSTITIQLGDTYYGGTLDVVSGVLTLTDGFISSYNGETLPSTWISDRDVYAEGTTPTIGAEVCYELATPLTIQLTPTAVSSLLGQNNLWANTGDVLEASYFESL